MTRSMERLTDKPDISNEPDTGHLYLAVTDTTTNSGEPTPMLVSRLPTRNLRRIAAAMFARF